jgi:hypothetical protein
MSIPGSVDASSLTTRPAPKSKPRRGSYSLSKQSKAGFTQQSSRSLKRSNSTLTPPFSPTRLVTEQGRGPSVSLLVKNSSPLKNPSSVSNPQLKKEKEQKNKTEKSHQHALNNALWGAALGGIKSLHVLKRVRQQENIKIAEILRPDDFSTLRGQVVEGGNIALRESKLLNSGGLNSGFLRFTSNQVLENPVTPPEMFRDVLAAGLGSRFGGQVGPYVGGAILSLLQDRQTKEGPKVAAQLGQAIRAKYGGRIGTVISSVVGAVTGGAVSYGTSRLFDELSSRMALAN